MRICIYGASSEAIDKKYMEVVENFSEKMARKGHSLVFGCGIKGLMGASVRGVRKGGGYIHGVIPKFFEENGYQGIYYDADKITWTKTVAERKTEMENDCQAFVVVPGGVGTFEELFEIISLKQLCQFDKPIAIYNIDGYYDTLYKFMEEVVSKNFMKPYYMDLFKMCSNDDEIFEYIESYYTKDRKKIEFVK